MIQWTAFNKRNKSSDIVKSLLATSSATLVCSIAEVRIHGWLIIKRGLVIKGAYIIVDALF